MSLVKLHCLCFVAGVGIAKNDGLGSRYKLRPVDMRILQ